MDIKEKFQLVKIKTEIMCVFVCVCVQEILHKKSHNFNEIKIELNFFYCKYIYTFLSEGSSDFNGNNNMNNVKKCKTEQEW